ncbi:hypothetical protein [Rhizosphaericola mali]|uniref:Uncharacterized protein n=1 Tax=Rhizosphaericola mali TaxID=2545455 RepID=A0A5P2G478_9BACT|nr:hypothetical protein [Rhizosphaericola mali]QES87903.1 hypothetical protein E0W69_004240 [Rhizosphaericola mali]
MLESNQINRDNFYQNTSADWTLVSEDFILFESAPDYISYVTQKTFIIYSNEYKYVESNNYLLEKKTNRKFKILSKRVQKSRIKYFVEEEIDIPRLSSNYWFTEDGVYRKSDHWGNVRDCFWKINSITTSEIIGFCKWIDFRIWK